MACFENCRNVRFGHTVKIRSDGTEPEELKTIIINCLFINWRFKISRFNLLEFNIHDFQEKRVAVFVFNYNLEKTIIASGVFGELKK